MNFTFIILFSLLIINGFQIFEFKEENLSDGKSSGGKSFAGKSSGGKSSGGKSSGGKSSGGKSSSGKSSFGKSYFGKSNIRVYRGYYGSTSHSGGSLPYWAKILLVILGITLIIIIIITCIRIFG